MENHLEDPEYLRERIWSYQIAFNDPAAEAWIKFYQDILDELEGGEH